MSDAGYRAVLKNPGFRRLWLGEVTSYLGDWFNTIAVYSLVQSLSGSAQAVAAVLLVRTLPSFLMTPIAGPLVDRVDRRRLLLFADVARALTVGLLWLAHEAQSLPGVFGALTLLVIFTSVAEPAKTAALPMIVPAHQLSSANALAGGSWSVMLALGAALGGVVTQWLGVSVALAVDAATYLVSFAFFWRLPVLAPGSRAVADERFSAGLRYLLRAPRILALTALKPLLALPMGAVALIPLYGAAYGGAAAAAFTGGLYTVRGLGALLGSFGLRPLIPDRPGTQRAVVVAGLATLAVGYGAAAIASGISGVALGYGLAAVGGSAVWVFSGTLLQQEADPAFHGRVFAVEAGAMTLVTAGSSWLAGAWVGAGQSLPEVTRAVAGGALVAAMMAGLMLFAGARPAAAVRAPT